MWKWTSWICETGEASGHQRRNRKAFMRRHTFISDTFLHSMYLNSLILRNRNRNKRNRKSLMHSTFWSERGFSICDTFPYFNLQMLRDWKSVLCSWLLLLSKWYLEKQSSQHWNYCLKLKNIYIEIKHFFKVIFVSEEVSCLILAS